MSNASVVLAASVKQSGTLIFLHGLGDTGHGWASAVGAIRPAYVKVICPTAQTMPVTLNAGFRMPSWFDLKSLDPTGSEDEEGIKKASGIVQALIEDEVKNGINPNRIIIGGFSQGGALALYSTLTYKAKLAGCMALSCWLPLRQSFPAVINGGNQDTPILQCHGDCDPIVPYKWGQTTATYLKKFASQTEFKTYRGMMHSSTDEEMRDLKLFVEKHLPPV